MVIKPLAFKEFNMRFGNIPGRQHIKQHLSLLAAKNRLPHALIFTGPNGTAKLATAFALAAYLNCTNRSDYDSCGTCNQCLKQEKLIHPDVHFSFPVIRKDKPETGTVDYHLANWRSFIIENPYADIFDWFEKTKEGKKTGNIPSSEAQKIIRSLSLKRFEGNYKISIIWGAEYLGKDGNRLLKLIEEPPENTLLILITSQKEQILNTILSRCQEIRFPIYHNEELGAYLQNHVQDQDRRNSLLLQANGNINLLIKSMEQENISDQLNVFTWLASMLRKDVIAINQWVESFFVENRETQKNAMHFLIHYLRECFVLKNKQAHPVSMGAKELKMAQYIAKHLSNEEIMGIVHELEDIIYNIDRNAHAKVLLMDSSIRIMDRAFVYH